MSLITETVWTLPRPMRAAVESRFYLSASNVEMAAPWTGQRSVYGPHAQVWIAELTPPVAVGPARLQELRGRGDKDHAGWREWQGFITRLRGTSGLVRVADYYRLQPTYNLRFPQTLSNWSDGTGWSDGTQWAEGGLPPFVVLDEAAQIEADSAVFKLLPPNTDEVLAPGDLFEMRAGGVAARYSTLHEVVHCARSNSDGKARVYFQPGLRQGYAAGDMAVLQEPSGVFRLADRDQGIVTRSVGNIGRVGLRLLEEPANG